MQKEMSQIISLCYEMSQMLQFYKNIHNIISTTEHTMQCSLVSDISQGTLN